MSGGEILVIVDFTVADPGDVPMRHGLIAIGREAIDCESCKAEGNIC